MKKHIVTGLAILGICTPVFAPVIAFLDTPNDNPTAVHEVQDRDELKPMQVEYGDVMVTRIWPLEYGDVINVFGSKLNTKPDNYALPLFAPHDAVIDLLPQKSDWRNMDYYAVGNIGYLQFYYDLDGKGRGVAVFYLHTDDNFVPLRSTNDFARRLEWEKAKLQLFEKWLDEHLPKMTYLGVVEVSSDAPSRVALGNGKFCIIRTVIPIQPDKTNDLVMLSLTLDSTNITESVQSRNIGYFSQLGKSISFAMDGRFFRLTPKLVKF